MPALYGPTRSSSGRPSLRDFEEGPLHTAETACRVNFEGLFQPIEAVSSLRAMVIITPAFGPLLLTACLVADGAVELLSVSEHDDYFDMIADDPID